MNAQTSSGQTPLHIAATQVFVAVILMSRQAMVEQLSNCCFAAAQTRHSATATERLPAKVVYTLSLHSLQSQSDRVVGPLSLTWPTPFLGCMCVQTETDENGLRLKGWNNTNYVNISSYNKHLKTFINTLNQADPVVKKYVSPDARSAETM